MPIPEIKAHCTAHMLAVGDMIAIYAGNETPSHAATVEAKPFVGDATPAGEITVPTTMGNFDVPANARLGIVAWAPCN